MRPLISILFQGSRHIAIGVAVLAVLMTAFRVHVHGSAGDGHMHSGHMSLSVIMDGSDSGPQPADPDGCDACTCPPADALHAAWDVFTPPITVAALPRRAHVAASPDSLSYPPDPPPVRPG